MIALKGRLESSDSPRRPETAQADHCMLAKDSA